MQVAVLLSNLARRGFTLRAASGRLSVSPATALTAADREAIRERRNELLAIVSQGEAWNPQVAIRLMDDADALVERLGVDGRDPTITGAAALVCSAYALRDMETVRFACRDLEVVVRKLAAGRERGSPCSLAACRKLSPE